MMKSGNHRVIAQIAGPGLVLAALFVLVLSSPSLGCAQSSSVSPVKSDAEQAAAKAHASPAANPRAKGEHEGIKVHGHWTIEVRNPDGKLVTHREFENSLTTASGYTGSVVLTDLLAGTRTGGAWEIILVTPNASLHIFQPNSPSAEICNEAACSPNLSVVAGTTQNPGTLTFTGFVTVPASQTSITQVVTDTWACIPTELPAACATLSLTDVNNGNANDFTFTSANLSPAITISPGQVVQATVNITFQ